MSARHILSETGRSISRNRATFALATTVQAICLTLLGIFLLLAVNLGVVVRSAGRNIELHVFLTEDADAQSLGDRIRCITGVADTRFVSKEEALAELVAELGEDSSLVTALGSNPLPASIRVSLQPGFSNPALLADIEAKVRLLPGVSEVWSSQEGLVRLNRLLRATVWLGLGILVIVSLAVAFIVFQTVDSSISSRAREIEIMELVGASRSVVRAPFILEGIVQGILAGACAFTAVLLLAWVAATVLPAPVVPVWTLLTANLGLGALLGLAGSLVALDRISR